MEGAVVETNITSAAAFLTSHVALAPGLDRFPALAASMLERTERLEQLRFLENGFSLYVEATEFDTVRVDTEEDLRRVAGLLKKGIRG